MQIWYFSLYRSIYIKSCIEPKIPMIKELEQGLALYGLLNTVRQQPGLFEAVFLESSQFDITLDDLLDSLEVKYSQSQLLKEKEEDVFKYFSDMVQNIAHLGECWCSRIFVPQTIFHKTVAVPPPLPSPCVWS
jgi:hypothetical protein